jgi:hypothetical protein
MAAMTIEDLIRAEARLSRAFVGYLFAVGSSLAWPMIIAGQVRGEDTPLWVGLASLGMLVVQIGLYIWYAIAAGAGAKALGETGWHYVAWILASPFLAMLPIPLVSTVIAVSPLSIKFLLGGQLQTAIREQTSMALHVGA